MTSTSETASYPNAKPPTVVSGDQALQARDRPTFHKAATPPTDPPRHDGSDNSLQDRLPEDLAAVQREVTQLRRALASSRTIGIAIGILMAQRRVTQDQAFEQLQQASQHRNRKLRDVAADMAFTGELLVPANELPGQQVDTAPTETT